MREENYFIKKLENSIETLQMAKSKLEHLDIQINLLKVRFEHDKKIYNDQTLHMQKIVSNMEKRIPELEKKLAQGYTTIDMRTGKAFKSFTERHVVLLKDKIKASEAQQKVVVKQFKEVQSLKKKKRTSLTPEQLDAVIAEEVREEAQPPDELKANRDREMERLRLEAEAYREKIEKLESLKKELAIREKKGKPKEPEIPKEEIVVESPEPIDEHEGKVQCPDCKEWFAKGGAFAKHYQSHVNGD